MKQNREIWRDIPDYEGYYEVSNLGRIRSLDRTVLTKTGERFYKGKIMESSFDKGGYKQVTLSRDGKQEKFYTHQLVAVCFLGHEPNGHSLVIDHINGVKTDNRVKNLRIVTHRDNTTTCHRKDRNTLSSDFAGVDYHKQTDKWQARIQLNSKRIHLGLFNNEIDAAKAYQKALNKVNDGTFKIEDYRASFTSNFKGITFHKTSRKWLCQPTINGKQVYVGLFSTEEEAYQAILLHEAIQPIVNNS